MRIRPAAVEDAAALARKVTPPDIEVSMADADRTTAWTARESATLSEVEASSI